MADDITIQVKAAVDQAKQGLAEVGQEASKLGQTVQATGAKHEVATAQVKAHHESLKQLGEDAKSTGENVLNLGERMEKVASVALGGPAGGIIGMWLGGMGAVMAIAEMVKSTIEWHTEIAQLSTVMNNNAQVASVWVGIADELKIPVNELEMGFRTLSEHIDMGSKALHEMGIATVDESGKLMPLNTVLQESQAWFNQHAGSSIAAARATELFGRAGQQLLPILEQNTSTFQAMQKELTDLGLVMDNSGLQKAREMDFELEHLKTVVQGLVVTIGQPLIQALAVAGSALSQAIVPHLEQIKAALQDVVNFIVGVISALTGWTFHINETAQALGKVEDAMGSAGSAADTLQNSTSGAADAAKALRDATQDQVNAIQDQVRALEEANRLLQDQSQQENFRDQQTQAAERKGLKLQEIARLENEYEIALREGNLDHAQQVYDQLQQAKQAEADAEMQDQRQVDDFNRQQQINTNQQTIQSLQDRQRAIQQAAQDAEQAMAGAAQGMSDAIVGAGGTIDTAAQGMQNSISDAGTQAGRNFGEAIKGAIGDIVKFFQESDAQRQKQLQQWGHDAGEAFGEGMSSGMMHALEAGIISLGQHISNSPWSFLWGGTGGVPGQATPHMQAGGIVPGPPSMPRPIIAHGSEMVLNPGQQANLFALLNGAGGGGPQAAAAPAAGRQVVISNVFNIYGATDPQAVADVVNERMGSIMGVQ